MQGIKKRKSSPIKVLFGMLITVIFLGGPIFLVYYAVSSFSESNFAISFGIALAMVVVFTIIFKLLTRAFILTKVIDTNQKPTTDLLQLTGVSMMEIQFLVSDKLHSSLVAKEIISLATKGYIQITLDTASESNLSNHSQLKRYDLVRTELDSAGLPVVSKSVLDALFAGGPKVSYGAIAGLQDQTLKRSFAQILQMLPSELKNKGYVSNIQNVGFIKGIFDGIFIVLVLALFVGVPILFFVTDFGFSLLWPPALALFVGLVMCENKNDTLRTYVPSKTGKKILLQYNQLLSFLGTKHGIDAVNVGNIYYNVFGVLDLSKASTRSFTDSFELGKARYFGSTPGWFRDSTGSIRSYADLMNSIGVLEGFITGRIGDFSTATKSNIERIRENPHIGNTIVS